MSIADEKYVSLTTFRKDGSPKSTPVWLVKIDEKSMGFTTNDQSWKVKRIHNNSAVEIQPSDARGQVIPGSSVVRATAQVATGADFKRVSAAIRSKYGIQVSIIRLVNKVASLMGKPRASNCAIVITPS